MPIPQSVLALESRANELLNQLNQSAAPAPAPATPAPVPAAVQPAPAVPAPTPPGSTPATPGSAPGPADAEHRFKVLQGKYNAEVPALHDKVRELTTQLNQQTALVEELRKQIREQPAPSLVRPEEIEEHGEGLVDLIRRAAREELAGRDAKIAELQAQLAGVQGGVQQTTKQSFFTTLAARVPNWAEINGDESFHRWLDGIDELSGRQRQDLLDEAHKQLNGDRAAAIFIAFEKARGTWAANASAALAEQVVPNAGAAGSVPTVPVSRVFTRAEVNDFYAKWRTGKLQGPEATAMEAEIQKAMIEGRIQ